MKENQKHLVNRLERTLQGILILILIVLTIGMMSNVSKSQGNARVVNYAGIIRGATQRMVKLEIAGQEEDELQEYLDDIFSGLMHGGGKYDLTVLSDPDYTADLNTLYSRWQELKSEVKLVREKGYQKTDILRMSEEYFYLADRMVSDAENCSQAYATELKRIERVLIVIMILIVVSLIHESIREIILNRKNRELKQKAYLDLHTGLPNKSRCEELLNAHRELVCPTTVMMFDLNGLKSVNDTLGHLAGDTLIWNFANILRTSIPEQHFVGRYGGDEFIVILENMNNEQINMLVGEVQAGVNRYNACGQQAYMEFAYGYASSESGSETNLKLLFARADKNMYLRKAAMKEGRPVR